VAKDVRHSWRGGSGCREGVCGTFISIRVGEEEGAGTAVV